MSVDEEKSGQPTEQAEVKSPAQPRTVLRQLGRFAAATPPTVTLLLSAISKPAATITSNLSSQQFKEPVTIPQLRKAD